jgi:multidrug efflux pump subunit AcrA (membrane-fusion protein)
MNVRAWLAPVLGSVVLAGGGVSAYFTRDSWWPYVFPVKATVPPVDHAHENGEGDHDHDEHVKLSPQARQNLKLEVGELTPRPYSRTVLIPGVVVERPGETERAVTTRIGGVVTAVSAKPGDRVSPGQRLFTIEPTGDILRTQVELAKAVKDLATLTATLNGVARQVADKTRPANDLAEPQQQVALAANSLEALKGHLRAWKLTDSQIAQAGEGKFVSEVEVTAPGERDAGGEKSAGVTSEDLDVHELKVRPGDTVQPGQTLCVLGSHRRLFVEGHAFASEAGALAELMAHDGRVKAEFVGDKAAGGAELPALSVARLSHTIDPADGTFAFYLPLDNQPEPGSAHGHGHPSWRYRPGQRVRLRVPVENLGEAVLVLPAGAVVREGAEAFAFVQNGDLFVRKAVRVLYEDRADVIVANDGSLPAGAAVVKNQAAALNRAVKAAAAGGDGGHHHDHEH